MAKQNSVNLDITNNADGFDIAGGTTSRKLTVSGADISLTGSGSATLTFPTTTGTVALVPGSDTQVAFNDGGSALGGDAGLTYNKTTDTLTVAGDIAVNGGDLTTSSATATVFNSAATTLSLGGAATTLNAGYDSTASSTSNISTGAVGSGNTKTVNIGTGGASGSTSNVNIGSGNGGTVTVNKDLVVSGDLTVNGTTTTVNSTTMTVDDPIITLGGDTAPGSDDNKDRGVEFRWHNGSAAKVGFFGYDDSIGRFTFIPDATNTSEVFSGTQGNIDVNDIYINGTASTGTGAVVRATSPALATSLTTGSASFDLINTTATTVNFAGAGTAVSIGAATGTTTINNTNTVVTGDLAVNGADITTTATGTATLFNTNATGVYIGGVATDVRIGKTDNTGTSRIYGTATVVGGVLATSAASSSLFDTTATTLDIGGAATTLTVGHDGTSASTTNITTGATGSGSTKTVNMGTGAAAGSTTNVNIGSSNGGTTTINSATVVGAASTQALYNTVATTMNLAGAATTLTMGATTGTAAIRNPTTRLGNTTSIITTNSGSTNSITIAPYGNVVINPTSSPQSDGDFANLTVTNVQAAGEVQITGADLYLGNRFDGFSTYTSTIVFEGATSDGFETTVTVTDPTADRTITLPNATGTVALVAGSDTQVMFNDGGSALGGDSGLTYNKTTDTLTVGSVSTTGLEAKTVGGDEGGQIDFGVPATNTTISSGVAIDVYQNRMRFYEKGGSARGFYIDITAGGASVSTNLVGGGGGGTPGGSDTYVQFNDGGTTFGGDSGLTYNKTTDSLTITGDLAVNGSDITTSGSGTATVFNSNALTLNLGGAATAITMGDSTSATTTVRGGTLVGNTSTQSLFNTTATTLNLGGAATAITMGDSTSATTTVRGGTLAGNTSTQNLFNTTATTLNIGGAATTVSVGAATGTTTINNANTIVTGDLAVNGGDLTSTSTTFNLLNSTVTTLNVGTNSMTTVNIGTNANGAAVNLCNGNITFSRSGSGMSYYSNLTDGSASGMNIKCNPTGSPIQIGDVDGANNTTVLIVDDSSAAITFYTGTGAYTFPGSNGASGQVLFTNGSGTLAWGDVSAGVGLNVSTTSSSATINLDDVFLFGDGADGDVTVTGSTTLTRDMFYNNLTINSSGSINTAGFRIYVKGTLDISAAAANSIQRNGTAGNTAASTTGATAVSALSSGSVGSDTGSGAGGNGGTAAGTQGAAPTASTVSNGGQNGASGKGGNGTSGNGGALRSATTPTTCPVNRIEHNLIRGVTIINGGICGAGGSGGGGDGTAGGGGGSGGLGGGVVFVAAKAISRGASTAAGCISANGGNGGAGFQPAAGNRGGGGGGSGGGGGWIYLMYGSLSGTSATNAIRASGGTGGNGANGSGTGTAGDGGTGGGGGRIVVINVGSGSLTSTVGTTGTANTGTTGGAGETLQVSI